MKDKLELTTGFLLVGKDNGKDPTLSKEAEIELTKNLNHFMLDGDNFKELTRKVLVNLFAVFSKHKECTENADFVETYGYGNLRKLIDSWDLEKINEIMK